MANDASEGRRRHDRRGDDGVTIVAAKLCPAGYDVVSLEQGPARWALPDLRARPRQPPLLGALRDDGRPRAGDLDLAAELPRPGAPDAPVRLVQPGRGARRRDRALVGAALALPADRLPLPLARDRALRRAEDPRGLHGAGLGRHLRRARAVLRRVRVRHRRLRPGGESERQDPPRRQPLRGAAQPALPAPAARRDDRTARCSRRRATDLGLHPFTQPAGILSEAFTDPYGNERGGCLYCGFCTRFGCEVDAKTSPQTTWLPVAFDTGRYTVRGECKVTRIEVDDKGRATGVTLPRLARRRALPAGRGRARVRVHAREQPDAAALAEQGAPERRRQRPRPGREELLVPDLSGAGRRRLRGPHAADVHGQHLHDQDRLRLQRRQLRPLRSRLHRRLAALLGAVRAGAVQLGQGPHDDGREVLGRRLEERDPRELGLVRGDRDRGREPVVRGQLPRPRSELPRPLRQPAPPPHLRLARRTSRRCGGSSPRAPRRSWRG